MTKQTEYFLEKKKIRKLPIGLFLLLLWYSFWFNGYDLIKTGLFLFTLMLFWIFVEVIRDEGFTEKVKIPVKSEAEEVKKK